MRRERDGVMLGLRTDIAHALYARHGFEPADATTKQRPHPV